MAVLLLSPSSSLQHIICAGIFIVSNYRGVAVRSCERCEIIKKENDIVRLIRWIGDCVFNDFVWWIYRDYSFQNFGWTRQANHDRHHQFIDQMHNKRKSNEIHGSTWFVHNGGIHFGTIYRCSTLQMYVVVCVRWYKLWCGCHLFCREKIIYPSPAC